MKILKNTLKIICILILILYSGFVFFLPHYLNSANFSKHLNKILYNRVKLNFATEGFEYKTTPDLKVTLNAKKISLYKDYDSDGEIENEENLFYAENLNFSDYILKQKTIRLNADMIIFNSEHVHDILPVHKPKKKKKTNGYDFIKNLNIKKAILIFTNDKNEKFRFDISDLALKKQKQTSILTFNADVSSPLLKNKLTIGEKGEIDIIGNSLQANELSVKFGNANVVVNGLLTDKDKNTNFKVQGIDIPVDDLEASLLYFQKLRKKGKVFIENFYDWGGIIDIDLLFTNEGVFGKCGADNLSAKSTLFSVPIMFEKAKFVFDKREIKSLAYGTLGYDKVVSDFLLTNLATPDQTVEGTIEADLHNDTVSKYVPHTKVKGFANAGVKYHVKNHKITVDYALKFNKGSNIFFKNANLGLEDKKKMLYVQTFKHEDILKLTSFKYEIEDENKLDLILSGDGLFKKENNKFHLDYLTCKTDDYAPMEVTGSFANYLHGGEFEGDLKYNNTSKQITGKFNVINSKFRKYDIREAHINADKDKMTISAEGTFQNEEFKSSLVAKNKFIHDKIYIYDLDLFLDKYLIKNRSKNTLPKDTAAAKSKQIAKKFKKLDVTIEKWNIRLNKIIRNRIVLENIALQGSLRDNIFDFTSSNISFAKGTMSAKGRYYTDTANSVIDFTAKNIDAAIVSDTVFDLPNEFEGIASAKIHSEAYNLLDKVNADVKFTIKHGSMPNLGSKEFYLKRAHRDEPWKVSLQNAVNVDVTKEVLTSDINGSFKMNNHLLKDVCLTSQQKYFAFAILGDYNIENRNINMDMFGKFNKAKEKGIKIFHIPVSIIVRIALRPDKSDKNYQEELKKVPPIQASEKDTSAFRVEVHGNLNDKSNLKVDLKRIVKE